MKGDWQELVSRSQEGDRDAFDVLVRRFRDMAVAYAYSILRDFLAAEDAAQEAFVQAFLDLPRLRDPRAFPAWLRRIVFKYCDRTTRRRRLPTRPFDPEVDAPRPGAAMEEELRRDTAREVLHAVNALPDSERTATALFYINGYSMEEVGQFLEVPVSTVKSRLYTARRRLRSALSQMVESTMKSHAPGESFNRKIAHVLDGIVRIGFYDGRGNPEDNMLPSVIRTLLEYVGDDCGLPGLGREPKTEWQWSACALIHGVSGMAFRFAWGSHETDRAYLASSLLQMYRQVLEAAGFSHEMILKPDFASGLEVYGPVSSDEDEFRRRIVESIRDRRMPVIGLRLFGPPEPGVIAGFEGEGEVILGWDHFQDMADAKSDPRVSYEPSGMFRKRDWFRDIGGIVAITGRSSRPPADRVYREALVRVNRDLCLIDPKGRPLGMAAFQTWIDALLDDEFYETADEAALRERHEMHHGAIGDLAERRAYGDAFLRQAARWLPDARKDLEQQAAGCLIMIHDLCWRLWQTVGDWKESAPYDKRFADPSIRRECASIVSLLRDLDLWATRHIHAALLRLGETGLADPPCSPGVLAGIRRIPFFSPRIDAAFGPGTDNINREGVTMLVPAGIFPLKAAREAGRRSVDGRVASAAGHAGGFLWDEYRCDDRLHRDRVTTDFVCSISRGFPALVTYDKRSMVAVGYHIHSMRLFLVDPDNPDAKPQSVEYLDGKLQGPVAFMTRP